MVTKTLDFIFDFASPNAYFAYRVLPKILDQTGARLNLIPCLLGGIFKATGNQAPMTAFGDIKGKLAYEALETQRFIEKYALSQYRMNPHFPLNSLLPMRAMVAATVIGAQLAFVEAVLQGFWEEGLKMDDPGVLKEVLDHAGLDGAALLAQTQSPEIKQSLIANTDQAVARGAFGIPTFFVGEEIFFGKERLGQVEEALASKE